MPPLSTNLLARAVSGAFDVRVNLFARDSRRRARRQMPSADRVSRRRGGRRKPRRRAGVKLRNYTALRSGDSRVFAITRLAHEVRGAAPPSGLSPRRPFAIGGARGTRSRRRRPRPPSRRPPARTCGAGRSSTRRIDPCAVPGSRTVCRPREPFLPYPVATLRGIRVQRRAVQLQGLFFDAHDGPTSLRRPDEAAPSAIARRRTTMASTDNLSRRRGRFPRTVAVRAR
ncbi:MAG: hypothetical protein QOD06_1447 [Candidatus Binatota bacterium]|nr:hypothetical protein [Candidatus Binatota bacterium]